MLLEQLHKYQSNLQINSDSILRLDKPGKRGWNECITAYQMLPFLSFYWREKTFDLFYLGRVNYTRLSRHGALADNRRSWALSRRSYRAVKLRIAALHIVRCGIRESFFEQDLFSANFSHRTHIVVTRCELTFCLASQTKLSASSKNLPLNWFICFRSAVFMSSQLTQSAPYPQIVV